MEILIPLWMNAPQAWYILAAYAVVLVALGALYFFSCQDHKEKLTQWDLVSREDIDTRK